MTGSEETIHCSVCSELIIRTVYLAQGGHWMGGQKCPVCRYSWEAKGETAEEVEEALRWGGAEGQIRSLADGLEVPWSPSERLELRGVILGYVPPGYDVDWVLKDAIGDDEFSTVKRWQKRYRSRTHAMNVSHHRRYLVKVSRKSNKGADLTPWYYAPSARRVEAENGGDDV